MICWFCLNGVNLPTVSPSRWMDYLMPHETLVWKIFLFPFFSAGTFTFSLTPVLPSLQCIQGHKASFTRIVKVHFKLWLGCGMYQRHSGVKPWFWLKQQLTSCWDGVAGGHSLGRSKPRSKNKKLFSHQDVTTLNFKKTVFLLPEVWNRAPQVYHVWYAF